MSLRATLKRRIPAPLHPPLRTLLDVGRAFMRRTSPYQVRVQKEIAIFTEIQQVHDLPSIAHYWSNKYLVPILQPFGFTNAIEFFRMYMARICREGPQHTYSFLSIGSGDAAPEINIARWLKEQQISNFTFECIDLNEAVLARARAGADADGVADHFIFSKFDVNSWKPAKEYHVILAIQCLHHFVALEKLFATIFKALHPDGYFMTDDMIGRNGHQRWPESLEFVNQLWRELPHKYTYNHALKRYEKDYENWDCSTEGFEGIRSQDILPLLLDRFHFDLFIGFGNIVDVFIDRAFGPNFDPENEWDRAFIDRVHALDVQEMESGRVKPTHILAAMTKKPVAATKKHKHLSPQFCLRKPDHPGSRLHGFFSAVDLLRKRVG